jgi:two-component system sensor histidine kinase UhpB
MVEQSTESAERIRVLIVEDEAVLASDVKVTLSDAGYAVVGTAMTADKAISLAQTLRPGIVLMDVRLKGKRDGISAAAEIKSLVDVPVVFMTAFADQESVDRAKLTQPFGYIIKPFDARELRTTIEMAVFRHQAERRLRESEQKFRFLAENARDIIFLYRRLPSPRFEYVSPSVVRLLGLAPEDFYADVTLAQRHVHPEDRHLLVSLLSPASPSGVQIRLLRRDGSVVWTEQSSTVIRDVAGNVEAVQGIARDISDRKAAEEATARYLQQVRDLATRLESVREEERKTIAREIHDELGQALTGLKIDLSWLEDRTAQMDGEVLHRCAAMDGLLNTTIRSVQRISAELRPDILDNLGLSAAVEWQMEDFQTRTGIKCITGRLDEILDIPSAVSTAVFRVFKEALTNVARHAKARTVEVSLALTDGCLTLEVSDDGRGITGEEIRQTSSLGLLGMRERTTALHGTFSVGLREAGGTRLHVAIPLPPTEESTA